MRMYKNIIAITFLAVLCFPVTSPAQSTGKQTSISGKINLDDNYQVFISFQNSSTEDQNVLLPISSSGTFSWKFKLKDPEFIRVVVTPKARNKQLAINFPLYIKPGTNSRLNLSYNDSTYLTLNSGKLSGANKALILYSNFLNQKQKAMFFRPPSADSIRVSAKQYVDVADAYITRFRISDQRVKNYLNVWAMNNYMGTLGNMARGNRRREAGGGDMLSDLHVAGNSSIEVYNLPEALLFPETYRNVKQYIQLVDTVLMADADAFERLKQRLILVENLFKSQQLKAMYNFNEIRDYVRNARFSADADFDMEMNKFRMLVETFSDSAMGETLLKSFYNLQFTQKGAPMPDVALKDANGNLVSLKSFIGKNVYIDMWASWCVPCIAEVPNLKKLEKDYEGKNIVFLSISTDDNKDAWKKKMNDLNLAGHQLEIGESGFDAIMNITGIPHFILYDATGKLVLYKAPRPGSKDIRTVLDSL